MNEVVISKQFGVNASGLRGGQAELFMYICLCVEKQEEVDLKKVNEIYLNHHNSRVQFYDGKGYIYLSKKQYHEAYINKYGEKSWLYRDAKTWLKSNIGSFVMRGLMSAVPKFKPEQMKNV